MERPHRTYRKLLTAPRVTRIAVGLLLVIGGFFAILPVFGLWMIPLGLVIMFFEAPWVREKWRAARAWWKARKPKAR
ncbi:MAG: hypothetical protein AAF495_00555 [Pseudomonadota bacterium]